MGAVVFALAVLMWLWGSVSLHTVRFLTARASYSQQSVWLALATAVGAGVLMALALLALPFSVLSRGWTQELLGSTQQLAILVVLGTGIAAFFRGLRQLMPAGSLPSSVSVERSPKQKRRS